MKTLQANEQLLLHANIFIKGNSSILYDQVWSDSPYLTIKSRENGAATRRRLGSIFISEET